MNTVTIVETDKAVIRLLQNIVECECGFRAEVYENGATFLDGYHPRQGCIVLRLNMRGISGIEVLEEIRRREWNVPVVAMSTYPGPSLSTLAVVLGARSHIRMPFEAEAMKEKIREACSACPVYLSLVPAPH